jgi:hypothetical protein
VPHTAPEILERTSRLAKAMRENGGTVVYVRVDFNDFLRLPVDRNGPGHVLEIQQELVATVQS